MNAAFRRSEALARLENLAYVIVEHLALITWYSNNSVCTHWQAELKAFSNAMKRYDAGKGAKHNFTKELIVETLKETIDTQDDKDFMLIEIESHGVGPIEDPDWLSLQETFEKFADQIISV